jgi:hypothetical protein
MKADTRISVRANKTFEGGWVALAAALCLAPAATHAADPGGSKPAGKSAAVTLESIPGSTAKRVVLGAKAAERLGIATGKVGEEPVLRRQMVSGLVMPPLEKRPEQRPAAGGFGGFGKVAAELVPQPVLSKASRSGELWVLVSLSPGEWDRLAKDKPARVLPLGTRDKLANEVLARPSGIAPLEDMKRSMLSLYYVVPGRDHGLRVNDRMRVELQLAGSTQKQKVVPYGAVYYDAKGAAWVYVNPKPLTFERQHIGVERIVGDVAVLSEGPAVGTPIVTVGAAMLYGAEIFKK